MTLPGLVKKAAHLFQGEQAEIKARDYLISQGLSFICCNYRCRHGELDLVMQDGRALVIVEVRYRKSDVYGSALESITPAKQKRITAATQHYLAKYNQDCPVRFDVVAMSGNRSINWIKNAF